MGAGATAPEHGLYWWRLHLGRRAGRKLRGPNGSPSGSSAGARCSFCKSRPARVAPLLGALIYACPAALTPMLPARRRRCCLRRRSPPVRMAGRARGTASATAPAAGSGTSVRVSAQRTATNVRPAPIKRLAPVSVDAHQWVARKGVKRTLDSSSGSSIDSRLRANSQRGGGTASSTSFTNPRTLV